MGTFLKSHISYVIGLKFYCPFNRIQCGFECYCCLDVKGRRDNAVVGRVGHLYGRRLVHCDHHMIACTYPSSASGKGQRVRSSGVPVNKRSKHFSIAKSAIFYGAFLSSHMAYVVGTELYCPFDRIQCGFECYGGSDVKGCLYHSAIWRVSDLECWSVVEGKSLTVGNPTITIPRRCDKRMSTVKLAAIKSSGTRSRTASIQSANSPSIRTA